MESSQHGTPSSGPLGPATLLGVLFAGLAYTYWNSLELAYYSWTTPTYSHGYLVPIIAAGMLWFRWRRFTPPALSAQVAGLGLLALGLGLRLFVASVNLVWPDMISFLPCLAGIVLLVGGWEMARWAWPCVAFLIFMFPLPHILEEGLLNPLQRSATIASTYLLQTFGMAAYSEGNRIMMQGDTLGIEDACSGLRMLTAFLALSTTVAMIGARNRWESAVIIISAVPIALAVNITRITVTGILLATTSRELAHTVFHDLAGWFMMPLALVLLFIELKLLSQLLLEQASTADLLTISQTASRTPSTAAKPGGVT